jgi:ADP-ribosylglycohydrolase
MPIPADYAERVYAGVLGKIIGVYLGRPFEGWTYERIMEHLGEIEYYVHEKLDMPLIVTDDDISGTFTFLRALPDHGNRRNLTPAEIGNTWLNYIIERKTILWWGGRGNSTEHTAYLNLKAGIPAPRSGSIAQNSQVVAEQIGSQIFIDGWAMVAPGDPALAADLARRAGSVSHDGEALYGAMVIAAMEAQAFVERDIGKLIDTAVTFIPKDSVIYRMIDDIREWHAELRDWRDARLKIAEHYGYDKYGGNCHIVPNHALIIHALLYGEDDLQKSLMIVNTSGWDTDCNSGNVGCLLGIKNGLRAFDTGADFRAPVADRLYLPTADGGRAITDALTEAYHIVNIGRALAGEAPVAPKGGARFHFSLPGAVQGFMPEQSVETRDTAIVENVAFNEGRALAIRYRGVAKGRAARVATPTFIPSEEIASHFEQRGYQLIASPTLYSGQTVTAAVSADAANNVPVSVCLYFNHYGEGDTKVLVRGEPLTLKPGEALTLNWQIPDTGGTPISDIGLEIRSDSRAEGTIYLDYLTWGGTPRVTFTRPAGRGTMWRHAWVNSLDHTERRPFEDGYPETFRLLQNDGRGMLSQGTGDWTDYRVSAPLKPHLCQATGIAARVGGLRRYYALLLRRDNKAQLVKVVNRETVLAEADFRWSFGTTYTLELEVQGTRLRGFIDGKLLFDLEDTTSPLTGGALGLICEEGRVGCDQVSVAPIE